MGNIITFKRKNELQVERKCGHCGRTLFVRIYRDDKNSFCDKSCMRAYQSTTLVGEKNPLYKHGNGYTRKDGRVRLYMPEHPNADSAGLVYRYRVVAERMIGRYLRPNEDVHHKNECPWDDCPENLEVLTKSEHMKLHQEQRRAAKLAAAAA